MFGIADCLSAIIHEMQWQTVKDITDNYPWVFQWYNWQDIKHHPWMNQEIDRREKTKLESKLISNKMGSFIKRKWLTQASMNTAEAVNIIIRDKEMAEKLKQIFCIHFNCRRRGRYIVWGITSLTRLSNKR